MERLTLAEFRERGDEVTSSVLRTPDISDFCSGPDWLFSAHDLLHAVPKERAHFVVEDEGNWLVFVEGEQERVYYPLESAWMFGCPLLGDPDRVVELLGAAKREWLPGPCGFLIGGVLAGSPLHHRLRGLRSRLVRYQEFPATDCMIIDLAEGVEAWMARRSIKFRRNLRSLETGGEIAIVEAGEAPAEGLFGRVLEIQKKTYKWRDETDIFQIPEYAAFYRGLLERLHAKGNLRLSFAQRDGEDLAYIVGGVLGRTYRGLQMSYVEEFRGLGLGNRLQWKNISARAAEGIVRYDLGMHSPYKERWADRREVRVGVFLVL